jgi:hypothetical protein
LKLLAAWSLPIAIIVRSSTFLFFHFFVSSLFYHVSAVFGTMSAHFAAGEKFHAA